MSSTTTIAVRAAKKARRSLKACRKCHERKVRCDVTRVGAPCSNCQCGNIDCQLLDAKRRGRKTRQDSCSASQRSDGIVVTSPGQHLLKLSIQEGAADIGTSASTPSDTSERISRNPLVTNSPLILKPSDGSLAREEAAASLCRLNDMPNNALPRYINPFPKSWGKDDVDYISKREVFNLPTPRFRNICLKAYVEWVHFFCPLLDLEDFLGSIATPSHSSGRGVSLMLLYAVLLTGVAFVDESHILEAGYDSRFAVRKEFFTKAKILYYFGYELDRKVLVQTLLLMSYFQERHDEPTNHWYWAELGCVMARTIGLFLDPTTSSLPERRRRLWKRIGWSCILRDRVLSLGVRMPPKVRQEEFRVPILSEDDFEPMRLPQEVMNLLPDCELLQDEVLQRRLARICIEKTKLCILLGSLFNCLYKEASPKLGETLEATLILLPKSEDLDMESVAKVGSDLQTWAKNLLSDIQHPQPTEPVIQNKERVAFAHCSMLHMFHQTIMCALYRPQILAAPSLVARDITTHRMSHATMMITRHFEDLQNYELLRFLPSSAVTFLLTAAVNHLVEYKTVHGEDSQQRHLRRFRDCLSYLKSLQMVHVYAKYGGIFLASSARQAGISILSDPPAAVPATYMLANPTDREGLGPWAVAHTPDVLMDTPDKEFWKMSKENSRSTPGHSDTSTRSTPVTEGLVGAHQVADNILFDGVANHVGDMNFQRWNPVRGQYETDVVTIETLSNSSGFMNNTIWDHGWVDQIAENWMSQLPSIEEELDRVSLKYPDIPSRHLQQLE